MGDLAINNYATHMYSTYIHTYTAVHVIEDKKIYEHE